MKIATAIALGWLLILSACGGNSNSGNTTGNFAGNWQMALQRDQTTTLKTESGFIVQSGGNLGGNFLLNGSTVCPGVGSAQGQVKGSNVSITVNQIGQTVNLTGVLDSSGSLTGTYSILASPCGINQVGSLTAMQVKTLAGTLQGTFTSNKTGGLVYQSSGKVAQAPNTGASAADLSGSMTSSNAPCFSELSISGSISGTSVVFNLLSTEGLALGQFHGTTTADATQITGIYDFLNTLPPPLGGCQDTGTAVFTVGS
jgi:hypothetical protein